jgi:hypothetical protein
VRICVTCHTWQHFDPDTIDPAALFTTVTPAATDPNPLEFGRMVHRIHRGKDLPTIHKSTWDGVSPSAVPSPTGLPLPFLPNRPGAARSVPFPWRKYSIVGRDGHERIFAQAQILTPVDPTATTQVLASGESFPRDLRDCAVCHGDVLQEIMTRRVSRRTCSGCHPEVWFQASSPAADPVRFPHAGGPQADDSQCEGCHVTGTPKLYAPLEEVHVVPARARRYNQPFRDRLRSPEGGERPVVTFRLWDRGTVVPSPSAPVPAYEPEGLTLVTRGRSRRDEHEPFRASSRECLDHHQIIRPHQPDYSQFSARSCLGRGGRQPRSGHPRRRAHRQYVYVHLDDPVGYDRNVRRRHGGAPQPRAATGLAPAVVRQGERRVLLAVHRRDGERVRRERHRVREHGERDLADAGREGRTVRAAP